MIIDKTTVERCFGKCCNTYSSHASVQKLVAQRTAKLTTSYSNIKSIFEIGCGTGFLTRAIAEIHNPNAYIINDISPLMVDKTMESVTHFRKTNFTSYAGDAEAITFPQNMDAVVSSSAIQWFAHPELFFKKAANSLKTGGLLAISTYGNKNFDEINTLTGRGINYPSIIEIEKMVEPLFHIKTLSEYTITQWFDSPIDILAHIRNTGVGGIANPPMPAGSTRRLLDEYTNKYSNGNHQVSLTWNPIIIIATRK